MFPAVKSVDNAFANQPIAMMRSKRIDHGSQRDEPLQLTYKATLPKSACNAWRALQAGIASLGDELMNHIHNQTMWFSRTLRH